MVENKLEEIIDLLAEYGGFDREYLRDKLLTFANDGRSKTKKEVAAFQMAFPDTWEEFEKHYGFYDSKQAYMFGNTRLIPSFRVQQWLDHIADIKRKKQSQENKMEQVAKLFNKKLGEQFTVNVLRYDEHGNVRDNVKVEGWFNDRGFHSEQIMLADSYIFAELLEGKAVIVDD